MALPAVISAGNGIARGVKAARTASSTQSTKSKLRGAASAAGAVGTGVWGVDTILDFVKDNYPDAFRAMSEQLEKFGIDIDDPALREAGGQTRDQIVTMMAQNGIEADAVANIGLSKLEAAQYLRLLAQHRADNSASVDAAQAQVASTGQAQLDHDIMNIDIASCCAELGLVGPKRARKLYALVRLMNTLREKHVEAFEIHESLYGSVRVNR